MKNPTILLALTLALPLAQAAPTTPSKLDLALIENWCIGTDNTVFSPYSIATVLAMTAQGAHGDSASEIAAALGAKEASELAPHFRRQILRLQNIENRDEGVEIVVANALYPAKSFALKEEFLSGTTTNFSSKIEPLDYIDAPEKARQQVNTWVAATTKELIKELIPSGVFTPDTRLTLVNAIYFKGSWADPFDPQFTKPQPFHTATGAPIDTPMMTRRGKMRYLEHQGAQIVELPYSGNQLSMIILLPPKGASFQSIAKLHTGLDSLTDWDQNSLRRDVILTLPRFKIEWEESDCVATLRTIGIKAIFDPKLADLSGIAGEPGELAVTDVIHKAFIEVSEEGTEAAAATAGIIARTSLSDVEPPVTFRADRPFLFLIRDTAYNTILFAGTLTQPQE